MSKRSTSIPNRSIQGSYTKWTSVPLPIADNTPEALAALQAANIQYRQEPWPVPFDTTTHKLHLGDARDLSWIPDESIHLVVTSPPYWTLKEYNHSAGQMGHIEDYTHFLNELDKVWVECRRVLVLGGESAASLEMCAFRVRKQGDISLCRFTRIFRFGLALSIWTVSPRFFGTRSLTV